MAKISRDLALPPGGASNLHARESLFATGVLAALNAEIVVAADGAASLSLDLRGTFVGTVEVQGTVDGTNYVTIPIRPFNQAGLVYATGATVAGIWVGKCAPFRSIRARMPAFTSGSAMTTLVADVAPLDDSLQGVISSLAVTATGASGAAVTLTLPNPGVGLRIYLTGLEITRSPTVALTAAATPTVVTTTNLPGTPAFTFGSDAAGIGVDKSINWDFALPLAASAQNTAVTIVAPLLASCIWRIMATYYIAP